MFHQSKLGRDVELQNTHVVLFMSPRAVMQVSTPSAQSGLGSQLVDWYREATSLPDGYILIDLSPHSGDRLRYCTNTGSIPSKLHIADRLKRSKILNNEHTIALYSPSVPIFFPQMQNLHLQYCQKEFLRFLCKCILNLLKGNLQSRKRNHVAKFLSKVRLLTLKRTNWKQRRDILASDKGLQLIKVNNPPVINHLS